MENWREIKEGGYEVSNLGEVRNKKSKRIVKAHANHRGYLRVKLAINKRPTNFTVHRLVAETFLTNQFNKPQVDHINRVKGDNRVENLRYATQAENMRNRDGKNVSEDTILKIISLYNKGYSIADIKNEL